MLVLTLFKWKVIEIIVKQKKVDNLEGFGLGWDGMGGWWNSSIGGIAVAL